jgi:uncharacterized protein YceK
MGMKPLLIILAVLALALSGCNSARNAEPGETTGTTSHATTETGPPPLTTEERDWLAAIPKLHKRVDKPFQAAQINLTRVKMMQLARALDRCGSGLQKLGQPTERLEPVHELAAKACKRYRKGAHCFARAARLSDAGGAVVAGTPEAKLRDRSLSCGFAAQGNGSNRLADAEAKADAIKTEVG